MAIIASNGILGSVGTSGTVLWAINQAVTGDTVTIPAGTFTWGTLSQGACTVNKAITIAGGGNTGANKTTISLTGPSTSNGAIALSTTGLSASIRITGIYFSGGSGMMQVAGQPGDKVYRIDNCTFDGLGNNVVMLLLYGGGYGLIDHCTFTAGGSAEMIHDMAYGVAGTGGWTNDVNPGTYKFVYIEDCTFICTSSTPFNTGCGGFYGSQNVIRHCSFQYSKLDRHGDSGTPSNIGTRWFEIYNNNFNDLGHNQSNYIAIRDGSGVVFNNTDSGSGTGARNFGFGPIGSDATGLVECRVGQGIGSTTSVQNSGPNNNSPAYAWNNWQNPFGTDSGVQVNIDFFIVSNGNGLRIKQRAADGTQATYNYTSFSYPYPLDSNNLPNPSAGAIVTPGLHSISASAAGISPYLSGVNLRAASQSSAAISLHMSGASFIPTGRLVDWTTSGIAGGIPSLQWPIYNPSGYDPVGGGANDAANIQALIAAAHAASPSAGIVVLLNPGTFVLTSTLTLSVSNVVLRGSGPNNTILTYTNTTDLIIMGQVGPNGSARVAGLVNITSAATKGSTNITVASTTGLSVGSIISVVQQNPTDSDGNPLVDFTGYAGNSASGHNMQSGTNNFLWCMQQLCKVTAINGLVITLDLPLYITFTNVPQYYILPTITKNSGLEYLKVVGSVAPSPQQSWKNIDLQCCDSCWVLGCESAVCTDRAHIYLTDCYRCHIKSNYVHDSLVLTVSGLTGKNESGQNYSLFLEWVNSANLLENNIISLARHSQVMNGGSGNVWGYNYDANPYMGQAHNWLPDRGNHGAHPFMNLWEGNDMPNLQMDFTHGSSSHCTFLRNYLNLIDLNPDTGTPMTTALWAVNIAYQNNYMNIVGNVLGPYGSSNTASSYQINADVSQAAAIYKLGYWDDGATTTPNATLSSKVESTIVRGGNWDSQTGNVIWNNNVPAGSLIATYLISQTLPLSLYMNAAPDYFLGLSAHFPSILGLAKFPSVDPSAATKMNKNPARVCYEQQSLATGGAFDPSVYLFGQTELQFHSSSVSTTVQTTRNAIRPLMTYR